MPGLGLVLDWAGLGCGFGTVYIVVTQAQLESLDFAECAKASIGGLAVDKQQ